MITILILLWILSGLIPFHLTNMGFKVCWYRDYKSHYNDEYKDDYKDEMLMYILSILSGIIFMVLILGDKETWNKKSHFYIGNSLWMIFYNKEKVEKHFKK